ncbi:MAG: ferredoxin [Trebonia sp.]|jgi:ferredoxin
MANSSRVIADTGACIGSGSCAFSAPAVFGQDEEGTVVVRQAEVTGGQADLAEEAADNCPAFAITVERISDGTHN